LSSRRQGVGGTEQWTCASPGFETSHRNQLNEEDAYACTQAIQAHWQNPNNLLIRNPEYAQPNMPMLSSPSQQGTSKPT
jgi:hypothetical protein